MKTWVEHVMAFVKAPAMDAAGDNAEILYRILRDCSLEAQFEIERVLEKYALEQGWTR